MGWRAALAKRTGGCRVLLDVHPAASADAFPAGFDPWRGRIGIRVTAPATDGKANAAVLQLVAARLDVPAHAVRLAAGAKDRRKAVDVDLPCDQLEARLAENLDG